MPLLSRAFSHARGFSCLARSRSTDYEKRETARSIQQNSSSCTYTFRCGTQSPATFPYGCLILLAGFLTFFKKIYIFSCLKLKRCFSISLVCCADSLDYWYKNKECVNTIQSTFYVVLCYYDILRSSLFCQRFNSNLSKICRYTPRNYKENEVYLIVLRNAW